MSFLLCPWNATKGNHWPNRRPRKMTNNTGLSTNALLCSFILMYVYIANMHWDQVMCSCKTDNEHTLWVRHEINHATLPHLNKKAKRMTNTHANNKRNVKTSASIENDKSLIESKSVAHKTFVNSWTLPTSVDNLFLSFLLFAFFLLSIVEPY